LWRYAKECEALWKMVVEVEYENMRGGWCSKEVMGTNGVGVQKHIRRGWDSVSNFVRFEVGVGSKVNFWHDIWCDDRPSMVSDFVHYC
jgi:hypothetical protein